ncbi:M48 family metallopeptidase [Botrimarina hoheduenensis]|uniref:Peptidase M48 domain-containing protein n=1 Tax=Botrimarina hoheduenensis TaxID=2528000 RepID=A0A5C5W798_9BACT|nr:M48 family metallopeptidase [Botrimarina hoheduenensis]TWT46484.1 hypothetical protein Pla111_15800 [Botrimarina hoheduenensis]
MATDFFQRQADARRTTAWLIGGFLIALVGIAAAVFGVTTLLTSLHYDGAMKLAGEPFPWQAPIGAATGAAGLIGLGSLYKVVALRATGGTGVAESLGGKRLSPDTRDPLERRLLNVTDEMAIASGTPSPPVFLIEERGINAFAAGYSPSDAVIGVTRGCAEGLTRDELQGVIAHEFSHILNGDMRMSIRMIGILHGVLLLGLIGQIVVRIIFNSGATYDSRRSGDDNSGRGGAAVIVVLAIGVALIVIGSIGSFVGGLIKAAVSRQREYLADASAVQFTRNPGGIAGALKRIGAAIGGGRIKHPRAAELSHMYFTQGVWEGFSSLMATHPPLDKRIRALDPAWDGVFVASKLPASIPFEAAGTVGLAGTTAAVPVGVVANAANQVGDPEESHRRYAEQLLAAIPASVLAATREPFAARAVVYALLLDRDPVVRKDQSGLLAEMADPRVVGVVRRLAPECAELDARLRLPLIDLLLPALAALSPPQYQRFTRVVRALVAADNRIGLFEWTLSQILLRHLRPKFERVRSPRLRWNSLAELGPAVSMVLATLAHASRAEDAFAAGGAKLGGVPLRLPPRTEVSLDRFREALEQIAQTPENERGRLIDAAAAVICADQEVSVAEAELLRGVSDLLDCPMPPLLAGQPLPAETVVRA